MSKNDRNLILNPGEYNLDVMTLVSYNGFTIDLRSNLVELVICESVDSACLAGYLTIGENVNLPFHVPLIGNEKLLIQMTTPSRDTPIVAEFFIYKLDSKLSLDTNEKVNIYSLFFTSEASITNKKTKISRSYSNMTYAEMVYSLCIDHLGITKDVFVSPTLGKKNMVFPFMSPVSAINLLAGRSVSSDHKQYTYMFYETLDAFWFAPLIPQTKDPVATYQYYIANQSTGTQSFKDIEKDFKRIESYHVMKHNDTLEHLENGVFAARMLTHDITKKTYQNYDYSYNDDFYNLHTMTGKGILPNNGDVFSNFNYAHYSYYPKHSFSYSGVENNDEYEIFALKRRAHLNHFRTGRMQIVVAGDSNRRVGDLVEAKIFAGQARLDSGDDPYDPYLSGKYLVSEVTHILQKNQYKMKLTLERDSLPIPYPETKVVE